MSQIQVQLLDSFGSDRSIAEAAWTSSATRQIHELRSDEDVARVVNMLADNGHSSPFEHILFKFWLRVPIACDRQIMTHRLQSSNGLSGRYRTMPDDFLEMPSDVSAICRKLDRGWEFEEEYQMLCDHANDWYQDKMAELKAARAKGAITNDEYKRVREFIRGVLPQHNMTERTTVMNLRSWANFIRLRLDPAAQPEIQEVARQMLALVKEANVCPVALEALERNGWSI